MLLKLNIFKYFRIAAQEQKGIHSLYFETNKCFPEKKHDYLKINSYVLKNINYF